MPVRDEVVREHVLQEVREEIRDFAREGMSANQINEALNGGRALTEAERDVVHLLIYHVVAQSRGHY